MTSLKNPHKFAEGDTVYDRRRGKRGVITTPPEQGRWIFLGDPDNPDIGDRQWHALYGDLQHARAQEPTT